MERTKRERHGKKIINRTISYLILIVSLFMLFYSLGRIVDYINLRIENKRLNDVLIEMQIEKERLELENAKLGDENYFSFYIKGKYQYDGNKIIEITSD